MIPSFKVF
jgi:hypothetical protein